jgi:hypothetical protein
MVNRSIPLFSDVLVASYIHQSESTLIESKASQGHREYPRIYHHEKAGEFGCRFHLGFGEADIALTHCKEKHEDGIGGRHIQEK